MDRFYISSKYHPIYSTLLKHRYTLYIKIFLRVDDLKIFEINNLFLLVVIYIYIMKRPVYD